MKKLFKYCLILIGILNQQAIAQVAKMDESSIAKLVYSKLDFNRLPEEVKQQINKNKIADKSLFNGIARAFVVDIVKINSSSDLEKQLSFLFSQPNLKEVKYISGNRIEIISSIETEATFFKELFLLQSVSANFIEQKFVVYQAK